MQYTLNRKLTRWWMMFAAAAIFSALMTFLSYGFLVLTLVFTLVGVALKSKANRCPYCGNGFPYGSWSKPHAGYCNKCGKLMEYDDSVAERERRRALKKD